MRPSAIPLATVWPDGQPFAGWREGREAADFPGIDLPPQFLDAWGRAHVVVGSPGSKDYLELVGRLPCVTCPANLDPWRDAGFRDYVPPEVLVEMAAGEAAANRDLAPLKKTGSIELEKLWREVIVGELPRSMLK